VMLLSSRGRHLTRRPTSRSRVHRQGRFGFFAYN
jgi:hypothetical protein